MIFIKRSSDGTVMDVDFLSTVLIKVEIDAALAKLIYLTLQVIVGCHENTLLCLAKSTVHGARQVSLEQATSLIESDPSNVLLRQQILLRLLIKLVATMEDESLGKYLTLLLCFVVPWLLKNPTDFL